MISKSPYLVKMKGQLKSGRKTQKNVGSISSLRLADAAQHFYGKMPRRDVVEVAQSSQSRSAAAAAPTIERARKRAVAGSAISSPAIPSHGRLSMSHECVPSQSLDTAPGPDTVVCPSQRTDPSRGRAPLAQLDRASVYGTEGSRFEPWKVHLDKPRRTLNLRTFPRREARP
jgi:hypothetical protein